jgi:hypothetical protein
MTTPTLLQRQVQLFMGKERDDNLLMVLNTDPSYSVHDKNRKEVRHRRKQTD